MRAKALVVLAEQQPQQTVVGRRARRSANSHSSCSWRSDISELATVERLGSDSVPWIILNPIFRWQIASPHIPRTAANRRAYNDNFQRIPRRSPLMGKNVRYRT